jgi:Cu-processing system permease protein
MILTSILLGAVFIAIGYLISALVRERATAAGIAIGVWLLLVVLFDMALLGALVVDQGRTISSTALSGMLLFNPTDVYRLFNLAGAENVSVLTNMSGIADQASLQSGRAARHTRDLGLGAADARRADLLAEEL